MYRSIKYSNKVLSKKWDDENMKRHQQKLSDIKNSLRSYTSLPRRLSFRSKKNYIMTGTQFIREKYSNKKGQ